MDNALKIKVFRKSILFCKYLCNGPSYPYEILCGGQLISCQPKLYYVRTRFIARSQVNTSCAPWCSQIFITDELKSQISKKKIWAFVTEIFAKQYWLSENFNFQCIFHSFTFMDLKSVQRWIIINFWYQQFLEPTFLWTKFLLDSNVFFGFQICSMFWPKNFRPFVYSLQIDFSHFQ